MANNPASQYPTQTIPPSTGYPYGSAQNVSSPGDGTGYPFEDITINDVLGLQQSLLNAAGIVPNGVPDSITNPQYLNALNALYDNKATGTSVWDSTVNYEQNALVWYNNILYQSKVSNVNKQPDVNLLEWQQLNNPEIPIRVEQVPTTYGLGYFTYYYDKNDKILMITGVCTFSDYSPTGFIEVEYPISFTSSQIPFVRANATNNISNLPTNPLDLDYRNISIYYISTPTPPEISRTEGFYGRGINIEVDTNNINNSGNTFFFTAIDINIGA